MALVLTPLEVPAWMFDRAPSASWRITTAPHVDLAALGALATLLRDTGAPSQSQEMGAALGSHDANRGDVHVAPAHDAAEMVFQFPWSRTGHVQFPGLLRP
jgi:hypothetical protein